jgi:N-acetylglucosaminyldiphosphoundecaprenol N-acetyl-beta-D-mannosaminyltransferase
MANARAHNKYPFVEFMKIKINALSYPEAVQVMKQVIANEQTGYICLTDVGNVVSASHDERLQTAINCSLLSLPDGAPLASYARLAGYKQAERISGMGLMEYLFADKIGFSHYLLGDTDQTINKVIAKAKNIDRNISITGYSPPFRQFTPQDNRTIIEKIHQANPDIIWVSFGGGKQEKWMLNNIGKLGKGIMIGAGAAFKWFTGDLKTPPEIFQKLCLQWFFRLVSEIAQDPRKGKTLFLERQLRKFPVFLVNFPTELASARRRYKRQNDFS